MTYLAEDDYETLMMEHLGELGWQLNTGAECSPETGTRTGWDTLIHRTDFVAALRKLNPDVPLHYLNQAADYILTPTSGDAMTENRRIHGFITDGYKGLEFVQDGVARNPTIHLISRRPDLNTYRAVRQVRLVTGDHDRRFDIVTYINGLPVGIIELKTTQGHTVDYGPARNQLDTYLREFGTEFRCCAIVVATDGDQAAYGTPFTPLNHFSPWNVDDDGKPPSHDPADPTAEDSPLERLTYGLFNDERILQLMFNYISFEDHPTGARKLIAKPHQYFAVTRAVAATIHAERTDGRAGVVWHTQGSGKSLEMALYTHAVLRSPELKNPTIVVITDRTELDGQLYASFQRNAILPEEPRQITNRADLRDALTHTTGGGILFTTLQKFGNTAQEREHRTRHPQLSARSNIIVVVDEAHRSHYDSIDGYARHLRDALPAATLIAFTGTPVSGDKDTRAVFGDYIDIYDLTRAVADGATVPVYYEPRHAVVALSDNLTSAQLNAAADEATSGLDDTERSRVEAAATTLNQIYSAPERVASVAADIVAHWENRRQLMAPMVGGPGKAMVVCASRDVCVAVYEQLRLLRPHWHHDADDQGVMKVVFSGSASDPAHLQPHIRQPSAEKAVKKRAADHEDPLEIIIVKDMLLTGFDSPSLHTLYLDRPMKGALLMQTLARVNRTHHGKADGLLVAYSPITANLEAALAEYTDTDQTQRPVGKNVTAATDAIRELLAELDTLTAGYPWRRRLLANPSDKMKAAQGLLNHLLHPAGSGSAPLTVRYRELANQLLRMWSLAHSGQHLCAEEVLAVQFYEHTRTLLSRHISEERKAHGQPVPDDVRRSLDALVDEAATSDNVLDIFAYAGLPSVRLDNLTPEVLHQLHQTGQDATHLAIAKLRNLLAQETTRTTACNLVKQQYFADRITEVMNQYTNANLTAVEVMTALFEMAQEVRDNARRGETFTPPLSEGELAVYDALGDNDSALDLLGDATLATIARELIATLRRDAKTDWTVRDDVRAKLRSSIRRLLVKYRYPPDKSQAATALVMEQLEALAPSYAANPT